MTIYIDIIFLENVFMNTIILLATATILKIPIRILRILSSSIIGSIYAIITYISSLQIYSNIMLKIVLSAVMVHVAFRPQTVKNFFKSIMIFYLTSFTFGVVTFALLYFIRPQDIMFENGMLIGVSPIKIIITGGIIGFIIITISFKNMKGKLSKKDMICELKIIVNNKEVNVNAIIDTGNFLIDPITRLPVIVVEKEKLKNVLPENLIKNTMNLIHGKEVEIGEYLSKIRIIPFNSLGKENGLLLGVKVDGVVVNYQGTNKVINQVIVGIYEKTLSNNDTYAALIGLNILEKGEDYHEYSRYAKSKN